MIAEKESFMNGVFALIISQFFIKILGLIYSIYLTNKNGFGDSGNAIYMSGYQIYALLLTISSIGVPNAISKLVSESIAKNDFESANRIFKIAFFIFSIIGFICTCLLLFGAKFISREILQIFEAEEILIILSPAIFFVSISSVIRGYCNGIQKMFVTAKSQLVEQILKTSLTICIVEIISLYSKYNTKLMATGANLATTLATIISFIYIFIIYMKIKKQINVFSYKKIYSDKKSVFFIIKKILKISIPMTISSLLASINKNIDSITVVRLLKEKVGEDLAKSKYGILSSKIDTLTVMPLSFNIAFATALVPSIASSKINNDLEKINEDLKFSILITILIGLPCTIGMFVFSKQILLLLFPKASEGYYLLKISSISIIFSVLTQTINGAFHGLGKTNIPAVILSFGVITKFILNILLIPVDSIYESGAVISSLISQIIIFLITYCVFKRNINLNFNISNIIIKPLISTILGVSIGCYLYNFMTQKLKIIEKISIIVSLLIFILTYIFFVIILKVFSKKEIYLFPKGEIIYKILKKIHIYY